MTPEEIKRTDEMQNLLVEQAKQLQEAYGLDTVAIVVTYEIEGEKWQMLYSGVGNAYARLQSLRECVDGAANQDRFHLEKRLKEND